MKGHHNFFKWVVCAFLSLACFTSSYAQLAREYVFSQSVGVYTPLIGGTVIPIPADDGLHTINLPVPFTYLGQSHSSLIVSFNGLVAFRNAQGQSSLRLDATNVFSEELTSTGGVLSVFGADLDKSTNGNIEHGVDGDDYVIQWNEFQRYNLAGDVINMQIRLNTVTNQIKFVYGEMSAFNSSSRQPSVGIRGVSTVDFQTRSVVLSTGAWVNSTAGTNEFSKCYFNGANPGVKPALGTTFTYTPPTCFPPSAVTASAIGLETATISWAASSQASNDGYVYHYSTSATNPAASVVGTTITTNSVVLQGLTPATRYYFWVKDKCSTSETSGWSLAYSFDTSCSSFNLPYLLDFENGVVPNVPVCTRVTKEGAGNEWKLYNSFSGKWLRYTYSFAAAANTWFFTGGLNLTQGVNYTVKFKCQSSEENTEKLKVMIGTDASAVAMTQLLSDHPQLSLAEFTEFTATFTVPTTGVHYVGFNAYSASGQFFLDLDDISVEVATGCIQVGGLQANNITVTDASVSWEASTQAPTEGYEYYLSTSSIQPNNQTVATGSTTNTQVAFANLTGSTNYYFWVRAKCTETEVSAWSPVLSFTTSCALATLPYLIDFEEVNEPDLPLCTLNENTGSGNNWETYDDFDNIYLQYSFHDNYPANTWFLTKGVQLEQGSTYTISYDYSSYFGRLLPEAMKVAYGTAQNALSMTEVLADHPEIVNEHFVTHSVRFSPTASGVYYFGFQAYSSTDAIALYLDNILVEEVICSNPTAVISGGEGGCSVQNFTPANVVLTGVSPWNLTYTDGITSTDVTVNSSPFVFLPTAPGVYTLDAVSDANCAGTVAGSARFNYQAEYTTQNPVTICAGASYEINGNTYTAEGVYTDVFRLANGCDSIVTTTLSFANFTAVGTYSTTTGMLTATPVTGAAYTWINCATNAVVGITADFKPTANGEYKLQVKVGECSETSACITVANVGVDALSSADVTVFPNPTLSDVTVQVNGQIIDKVVLVDQKGQVISTFEINDTKAEVSLSDVSEGMYFLHVYTNGSELVKKVIRK